MQERDGFKKGSTGKSIHHFNKSKRKDSLPWGMRTDRRLGVF